MSALRRRLARAVLVLAALAALGVVAGCGSAGEAPEQPFGTPPAPAPGVHAWAAGEPGVVLATADGGATWTRQQFFLPQRGVDVAFADASTGWLATDAGTVLRTTDGGAGWTVVEQTTDVTVKAIAAPAPEAPGSSEARRGRPASRPPRSSCIPPTAARPGDAAASARLNSPTSRSQMSVAACWSRWTGSGPRATVAARGGCVARCP